MDSPLFYRAKERCDATGSDLATITAPIMGGFEASA